MPHAPCTLHRAARCTQQRPPALLSLLLCSGPDSVLCCHVGLGARPVGGLRSCGVVCVLLADVAGPRSNHPSRSPPAPAATSTAPAPAAATTNCEQWTKGVRIFVSCRSSLVQQPPNARRRDAIAASPSRGHARPDNAPQSRAPDPSGRLERVLGWSRSTSSVSRLSVSGRMKYRTSLPRTLMLSTLIGLRPLGTILTVLRCVFIAMSTPAEAKRHRGAASGHLRWRRVGGGLSAARPSSCLATRGRPPRCWLLAGAKQ